uniref:Uncharacterized protein n=1 Tax=Klebsiella pneumoniae TaxID=573 RepID=A0A8B0SUL5_KLEPN|nr:hypothetical protein [Klebsiella pneumoniae]
MAYPFFIRGCCGVGVFNCEPRYSMEGVAKLVYLMININSVRRTTAARFGLNQDRFFACGLSHASRKSAGNTDTVACRRASTHFTMDTDNRDMVCPFTVFFCLS